MMFGRALKECAELREELDEHLDTINANTRDVADMHEILAELDAKIEKVSTRMDELYILLGAETQLSTREAALQAFLQVPRSMQELRSFCAESEAVIEHTLRIMHLKGVSVHGFEHAGTPYFTVNLASKNHISLNSYF